MANPRATLRGVRAWLGRRRPRPYRYRPPAVPDPAAARDARAAVLDYLATERGHRILSGQMDLVWDQRVDMVQRVRATTGCEPAILGFDFLNATSGGHRARSSNANNQVRKAHAWWRRGGLVSFCWHWRDPSGQTQAFYTEETNPGDPLVGDRAGVPMKDGDFDDTSRLGRRMRADLDFIAQELRGLRDAGVPVLWGPLHEAAGHGASDGSGAWFWWGRDGAQAYIALYRYMHRLFTQHYGLDNLIWVWNGQSPAFYPGHDVVDVVGWDSYDPTATTHAAQYAALQSIGARKPAALTEVGRLPDPDRLFAARAHWSWFLLWNDRPDVTPANAHLNYFSGSGAATHDRVNYPWNTPDHARAVYQHRLVVTREDLPTFHRDFS